MFLSNLHHNSFSIVSNNPAIIGTDIDTIITFPPRSILLAIAASFESLHILTANSVKIAIPVILSINVINSLLTDIFDVRLFIKDITFEIFENTKVNINAPAINDTYIANSGLYCFNIIIIISAISPIPYYFNNFHKYFLLIFHKLKIVLTVPNKVLISFITIVNTITRPARVVIIA